MRRFFNFLGVIALSGLVFVLAPSPKALAGSKNSKSKDSSSSCGNSGSDDPSKCNCPPPAAFIAYGNGQAVDDINGVGCYAPSSGDELIPNDDPELTCRIPGLEQRSPMRVVLDTRLRLTEWSKLAQTARDVPTLVFTSKAPTGPLAACGVEIVQVQRDARGRPDINFVLKDLANRGVTRLLVEGGASVHASFLDRGFADRLEVFGAPAVLGGSGRASIDALAALSLDEAPRFKRVSVKSLGADVLESFAATA